MDHEDDMYSVIGLLFGEEEKIVMCYMVDKFNVVLGATVLTAILGEDLDMLLDKFNSDECIQRAMRRRFRDDDDARESWVKVAKHLARNGAYTELEPSCLKTSGSRGVFVANFRKLERAQA